MTKPKDEEMYLGDAEVEPVENPADPDYALRVAAADALKVQPDQREIPQTKYPDIPANVVADTIAVEQDKKIDEKVREMKKSGEADHVVPASDAAPFPPVTEESNG
jgi:hypothetical protein